MAGFSFLSIFNYLNTLPLENTTILLLILSLFVGIVMAYFQYFFKEKSKASYIKFVFVLRSIGIFLLFAALINPSIILTSFEIEKPILNVLVDNSKSIDYLGQKDNISRALRSIKDNNRIAEKYEIKTFQFSEDIQLLDSLSFVKPQTNIYSALSKNKKLNKSSNQAVVLLTDGNQTVGIDYKNYVSKAPIYPVVFGDTLIFDDISISRINVNRYTYVGNEFPVELFISSSSNQKVTTSVSIKNKGRVLSRRRIQIAPNSSKRIEFRVSSKKKGTFFYEVEVTKLLNEKNIDNNKRRFSIEAIDEKSKILIVSSILHPDIGALKRSIESNKKRSVEILKPEDVTSLENYQSLILYQPNSAFKSIIETSKTDAKSFFIITGKQTDYQFLNSQNLGFRKNAINETEKLSPVFNANFLPFQQDNIGFNEFSPLMDVFGEIVFSVPNNLLIKQRINGVETKQPLFTTINNNNYKIVVLFGEGIWQWRASSFLKSNSFKDFDNFINNTIQYITNATFKNRLEVDVQPLHYSNQPVEFNSYFFDENFQFDKNAQLELELTNQATNETQLLPFSIQKNSFMLTVDDLSPGTYQYIVKERRSNLTKRGRIEVLRTEIEAQFVNANDNNLRILANNSKGELFYSGQVDDLLNMLQNNQSFKSIQKSVENKKRLLDWWYYLLIVAGIFSIEWFVRKYHGKI